MVGSDAKAQKAASAMRKGNCIIQLGSRGCSKPPADSRQNSGGVKGQSPRKSQEHYILFNLKRG